MALCWEQVDLAVGVIHVERAYDDKEQVEVEPKSRAGRRTVPRTEPVLDRALRGGLGSMSDPDTEASQHYEDPAHREPGAGRPRRRPDRALTEHVPVRFPSATIEVVRKLAETDGQRVDPARRRGGRARPNERSHRRLRRVQRPGTRCCCAPQEGHRRPGRCARALRSRRVAGFAFLDLGGRSLPRGTGRPPGRRSRGHRRENPGQASRRPKSRGHCA